MKLPVEELIYGAIWKEIRDGNSEQRRITYLMLKVNSNKVHRKSGQKSI